MPWPNRKRQASFLFGNGQHTWSGCSNTPPKTGDRFDYPLPISTADVTLAEAKARIGHRICLMGAVQSHTLETSMPQDVRQQLHEAIEGAQGGGFVLLPTSPPLMVLLEPQCLENSRAMYLAAHEFGGSVRSAGQGRTLTAPALLFCGG